jgi:hypothetical protein
MKGPLNPRYLHNVDHTVNCEWCKRNFEVGGYKARLGTARFCSNECRRAWYATVWSQTDEWKQNRREYAIYQRENGTMSKTESAPQILINNLLDEIKINYKNEKSYDICSVDNYLIDYNLIIEVMGTYFHCDIRKYNKIPYENQVNRIRMDKIKHSYIKNNIDIEILYLWEYDINNNLLLCKKLIKEYIDNNGILKNYHSINYSIVDNELILNNYIIIPYMDWDINEINKIVDIQVKEKMSHKQPEKWITFNCENCNKEKEELICHYNNANHHFCSQECSQKYRKENDWHKEAPLPISSMIE